MGGKIIIISHTLTSLKALKAMLHNQLQDMRRCKPNSYQKLLKSRTKKEIYYLESNPEVEGLILYIKMNFRFVFNKESSYQSETCFLLLRSRLLLRPEFLLPGCCFAHQTQTWALRRLLSSRLCPTKLKFPMVLLRSSMILYLSPLGIALIF